MLLGVCAGRDTPRELGLFLFGRRGMVASQ